MSTKRIRYAVVGLGHIAQVAVLPGFSHARRNSQLVALVSGDRTKRREIARRYRLAHAFDATTPHAYRRSGGRRCSAVVVTAS
jgi:predicted dehydrogenase